MVKMKILSPKHCLTALLFFILGTALRAQTLSVESFRLLENDLAANIQGTMRFDQNGQVAALIRVVTSEKGFVFDGGMLGVVDTKQDVGEILIWVPRAIQRITIKHELLGVLRDYYFPIPIEGGRTYELKLLSGRVRTIVEEEQTTQLDTIAEEAEKTIQQVQPVQEPPVAPQTIQSPVKKPILKPNSVYAGVSMFVNSKPRSMDIHLGGYLKNINLEIGYSRFEKDEVFFEGQWNSIELSNKDLNDDGLPDGFNLYSYRYQTRSKYSAVLGYGIQFGRRLRLTPQTGAAVYSISTEGGWDESIQVFGESGERNSYFTCIPVNLKFEFSPVRHVSMFYTPGMSIPVKMGSLAKKLDHSNKLTATFKGITHNIGLLLYF